MTRIRTLIAATAASLCLVAAPVRAHGGQYRGPNGSTAVPPAPGSPVPGGPTTGGSSYLDVNSWRVWWQLNQYRFLGVDSSATDEDRGQIMMPALVLLLANTKSADVRSAGLVALGKCAVDHPEIDVVAELLSHLQDGNSDAREAAVLALGLCARPSATEPLQALLADSRNGRRLVGRSGVDDRMRAFAGYALGLSAQRSDSVELAEAAMLALSSALADRSIKDRDVLTGVLSGFRLLGQMPATDGRFKRVRWMAIQAIERHLRKKASGSLAVVRSHGLTALAQLARGSSGATRDRAIALVREVLDSRGAEGLEYVSATIALGELLGPQHVAELDLLVEHVRKPRDSLVPKFAMIALGQIGGDRARAELERSFRLGKRDLRPWAAIGLGLLVRKPEQVAAQAGNGTRAARPAWRSEIEELLVSGLASDHTDDLRAATAIGLGLAGIRAAAPRVRELIAATRSEEFRGYWCMALAMLGDRDGIPIAEAGLATQRNPVLLGQAALALGRYGTRKPSAGAVDRLRHAANLPGYVTWLGAAAQAIGYLKNGDDVPALVELLPVDRRSRRASRKVALGDLRAAFAAAALGSIGDRDPLGFGARIARGMNYAVREQTVSNGKTGVLDIF